MVKNTTGGSSAKGMARKNTMQSGGRTSSKLRISEQEDEIYAVITKLSGGGMCIAQCIDKVTRTCIIRGKFKGKGKRDNIISPGSWVLVGAREWESDKTNSKKELNKCDLLEIYSDSDKKRLQASVDAEWSALQISDGSHGQSINNATNDLINFQTDAEEDYKNMMDGLLKQKNDKIAVIGIGTSSSSSDNDGATACDDIIDIDAI
jgi:translation initiation factor IF-1